MVAKQENKEEHKLGLLYQHIFNHTQEAILIVQNDSIVMHNQKLLEFTGYSADEITQLAAHKLICSNDTELIEACFRQLKNGRSQECVLTFRIIDKPGELRWMEGKINQLTFNDLPAAIFYIYDISEFKQAEEAVNVSIDFLNRLIDTIPIPMFYQNTKGVFIGCNHAFVNFVGLPKEYILGKTSRRVFASLESNSSDNQKFHIYETQLPHADGSLHDVISYEATFYMADKSEGGSIGLITDISEQKQVENQLRHTESRFRQLVNNLNDGVLIFTPRQDGLRYMVADVNVAALKILKTPRDKIVGHSFWEFFEPLKGQALYKQLRKVWENGKASHYKQWLQWPHETRSLLQHFVYKVPSGDIVCIFSDITEIEANRNALAESAEKYRFLVENTNDSILRLDENLSIQFANFAFAQKVGSSPDALVGTCFLDFIKPDQRSDFSKKLSQLILRNEEATFDQAIELADTIRWFSWSFGHLSHEPEGKRSLVAIGHDITERIATEQALLKAKLKAEESEKIKSVFMANMSHEIRTPLNAIIGSSELMIAERLSPDEIREHLQYIMGSGTSLLNLINEIIDSAKLDAGKIQIHMQDFNLQQLFDEIYGEFLPLSQTSVHISYHKVILPEDFPKYLHSDPFRIKQIIRNLLSNAFKFTDSGTIGIEASIEDISQQKKQLAISVFDTGIGIPADKHEHIFIRFGQVDDNYPRNTKGTGLGLAIAKQLAQLLGGDISLWSEEKKGSRFTLSIPVTPADEVKNQSQKPLSDKFHWPDLTILIAEDNRINYLILRKGLERSGANLLWAQNGKEAIALHQSEQPDIVLMDMQMPQMDGFEATRHIRATGSQTPIIAQTAAALHEYRERFFEAGCNEFITKPIHIDELLDLIHKTLKNNKLA